MVMQGQAKEPAKSGSSSSTSQSANATTQGGGGLGSAVKQSLVGQPYDVQEQMLSPNGKGNPKDPAAAGKAPGAAPTTKDPDAKEAPTAPVTPAGPEAEIAQAITTKRAAAAELVKAGKFDTAFQDLAAFLTKSEAEKPNETKAALATVQSMPDWLVEVVGLYLKSSPVGQEVLKQDKGPAKGKDDKSAEMTAGFVSTLSSLQTAVSASFPADGTRAVKEITVRRELFKLFAHHHDKSQEESGIGSAQSAVKGKIESRVTSCNAYQGQLLRQAFGNADAESSKEGGAGKIDLKKTTTYGWDMVKKKETRGPKQRNFGLFDSLGRSAKEVGAWTPGGPGLQPKAGDILIYLNGSSISHIGFFKFAEDCADQEHQIWHTFDGGQIAGKPMTGTAKGKGQAEAMVHTVQDGALNNMKRAYHKANNTIETPSEAQLATLRGEEVTGDKNKKPKVNQDGLKRKIGGVIDIGKFIELDKKDEAEAAQAAMPANEKPKDGKK